MLRIPLTIRTAFSMLFVLTASTAIYAQTAAQPLPFPELGGAAKLVTFTGQVSVMRDTTLWALKAGDLIQPQQVVRTGADGYAVFQVSDGSKFEVFPNSKVVFRANRGDWKDLLEVFLGKVRVQIEHFGGLPNHNKVRTPSAVISVRGTVFDVDVEDEETATTLVLVEEGRVEVARALRLNDAQILNAGEWLRVYRNQQIGKALLDKGSLLQRAVVMARDAAIQVIQNARAPGATGTGTAASTASPGDKNNGPPAPTAPPPPPPPHP